MALPVFDLSASLKSPESAEEAGRRLFACCRDVGFFYVTGHEISEELIDRVFLNARSLFALPESVKASVAVTPENFRGYTAMGAENLDPKNKSRGDTKEGFYIGRALKPDEPETPLEKRDGNKWPPLEGFEPTMTDYFGKAHAAVMKILRLLAIGLGQAPDFFEPFFAPSMEILRLLRYEPVVSDPGNGVIGCGAHSDYGAVTLLKTDEVDGLEVFVRSADTGKFEWVAAPPIPGAFIVNIGDLMSRWTNGVLRSTVHRVVNRKGLERYSVPFFAEPGFHSKIECIPSMVPAGENPKFDPIIAGEYLLSRYAETYS